MSSIEPEEKKIDLHYQAQAKQLVDTMFDLGLLSESLSRDGIDSIEGLVALYFQQIGDSSSRCAAFAKKYKMLGGRFQKDDDDERKRHEEEMRWIARAREAEAKIAELEATDLNSWAIQAGNFLKRILIPPYGVDVTEATRLYSNGVGAGIIPEDPRVR